MFLQAPVTCICALKSTLQGNLPGSTDSQRDKHDRHETNNKAEGLQPSVFYMTACVIVPLFLSECVSDASILRRQPANLGK